MILTITTDWIIALAAVCQLLITGVGFWLLYTTFVLQAKVSVDQQRMLEIETNRARREIRPTFKADEVTNLNYLGCSDVPIYCEINNAYNVAVTSRSGKFITVASPNLKMDLLKKDEAIKYNFEYQRQDYSFNFKTEPGYELVIDIQFDDEDGFTYKQTISGSPAEVVIGRPKPVPGR